MYAGVGVVSEFGPVLLISRVIELLSETHDINNLM